MNIQVRACRKCGVGQLSEQPRVNVFSPPSGEVSVTTYHLRCNHCDAEVTTTAQAERNVAALDARRKQYGPHMIGADYLRFRKRYGLTQADANKLFGKKGVAFSRYENETSFPDETTTALIQLAIDSEQVVIALAALRGVELPLVEERKTRATSNTRPSDVGQSVVEYAKSFNWIAIALHPHEQSAPKCASPLLESWDALEIPKVDKDAFYGQAHLAA